MKAKPIHWNKTEEFSAITLLREDSLYRKVTHSARLGIITLNFVAVGDMLFFRESCIYNQTIRIKRSH